MGNDAGFGMGPGLGRTGRNPYKPKVEVRAPHGGAIRTSWSATREGDRALFIETDHKGVVKIYPGGPVIQWDDTGELEPDIAFTLVGSEPSGSAGSDG